MTKFVYVLELGSIYPYALQPDGSLSSLGAPVQCAYADHIAYSNTSKFPPGEDYLFIGSIGYMMNGQPMDRGISVYHVEKDGSLTLRVDHFPTELGSEYIAALWWDKTSKYFIYGAQRETIDETRSVIRGFQFTKPSSMVSLGDVTSSRPDAVYGLISGLDVVSARGTGNQPSTPSPYVFSLYSHGGTTWIASFRTSTFGLLGYEDSAVCGGGGLVLVASPNGNFAYVLSDDGSTGHIDGFKVQAGQFTSLGTVAELPGPGSAGVVSPDEKYLFVSSDVNPLSDPGPSLVFSYKIGPDGFLTKADQKPCGRATTALTVEPGGQYLYAPADDSLVYIYEINSDGTLTPKPPASVGTGSVYNPVYGMVILDV